MNWSCSSLSFAGFCAARSFARLKSVRVSNSSHLSSVSAARGFGSHGALWMVLANQPSAYRARLPNISKYWTLWRLSAFASSKV